MAVKPSNKNTRNINHRGKSKMKSYYVVWFLVIMIAIGWVLNLTKLSSCDFEPPYKAEIIYGVGLVPIVGAITGWMDIEGCKK